MNIRRMASVVAAIVLAGGLVATTAGTAFAEVNPVPYGVYELYAKFFNTNQSKCLDVDHSQATVDTPNVDVYNCHGFDGHGDNQLWETIPDGTGWLLYNLATHECLTANPTSPTQAVQEGCVSSFPWQIWDFSPNPSVSSVTGRVINRWFNTCLATADSSGGNVQVVVAYCVPNDISNPNWIRQNWYLA